MDFRKLFVRYFVPHKHNAYRPHFLRLKTVGITAGIILALFLVAVAADRIVIKSNSPQAAAVIVATLVDLANSDRTQNNLPSLTVNPTLERVAQLKAADMAAKEYFSHDSPDGRDPWYWFTLAGYDFSYAGENLAVYFSDSTEVNTAWMNSPEHRANLLNSHFTEIGIAVVQGVYQGHQTTYVVQEFGTSPRVAKAVTSPTPANPSAAPATTAPTTGGTPAVKAATTEKPKVKVIMQDENFIAVKNENAPTPAAPIPAASAPEAPARNPLSATLSRVATSPRTDLRFVYELIGAIILLALILEIGIELKRQHPHRIVLGLSLIGFMVVLLYVGQAAVSGQLLIA
jgi:hypothetical protein